jgi:hypothetical protein
MEKTTTAIVVMAVIALAVAGALQLLRSPGAGSGAQESISIGEPAIEQSAFI